MKFKITPEQERSKAIFGRVDRLAVYSAIARQDGSEIDHRAIAVDTAVNIGEVNEAVYDLARVGIIVEGPRGHYRRNAELDWKKLEAALDEINHVDPQPCRPADPY